MVKIYSEKEGMARSHLEGSLFLWGLFFLAFVGCLIETNLSTEMYEHTF